MPKYLIAIVQSIVVMCAYKNIRVKQEFSQSQFGTFNDILGVDV